jgi:hypothetical protein
MKGPPLFLASPFASYRVLLCVHLHVTCGSAPLGEDILSKSEQEDGWVDYT